MARAGCSGGCVPEALGSRRFRGRWGGEKECARGGNEGRAAFGEKGSQFL